MIRVPNWFEESISPHHDKKSFDCGDKSVNDFLRRYALQNHKKGSAKTFLAVPKNDPVKILGFYSLCTASIAYARAPDVLARGLGRHEIPAFRLARLAIDVSVQGQGLGGQLLMAAGSRCLAAATQVGGLVLLIDAKNESTADCYKRYGAITLNLSPLSLVLPLKTIYKALKEKGKT